MLHRSKLPLIIVISLAVIAVCALFIILFIANYPNNNDIEGGCCTCLDCPECDVCCDCANPYLNKK